MQKIQIFLEILTSRRGSTATGAPHGRGGDWLPFWTPFSDSPFDSAILHFFHQKIFCANGRYAPVRAAHRGTKTSASRWFSRAVGFSGTSKCQPVSTMLFLGALFEALVEGTVLAFSKSVGQVDSTDNDRVQTNRKLLDEKSRFRMKSQSFGWKVAILDEKCSIFGWKVNRFGWKV